jgi:hypothetical protein
VRYSDHIETAKEDLNMDYIKELQEESKGQFMQPEIVRGRHFLIEEIVQNLPLEYRPEGYYCRLSAGSYLDCTDWNGPFETIEDAARHLLETYFN